MIIDATYSATERKMKEADFIVSKRFQKLDLPTFKLDSFVVSITPERIADVQRQLALTSNNPNLTITTGTMGHGLSYAYNCTFS